MKMTQETQKIKGVNLYALQRAFWRENEYEHFSMAEIAIYYFLLDRANSQRWQMPFRCPTSVISNALGVTRQVVIRVRESLRKRNLIDYSKGKCKGCYSMYSIVVTDNVTVAATDAATDDVTVAATVTETGSWTDNVLMSNVLSDNSANMRTDGVTNGDTVAMTDGLTASGTDSATPYNIKDNNIKNKTKYNSISKRDQKVLSLEDLEIKLGSDESWLDDIRMLMAPTRSMTLSEVKTQLDNFIRYLRCQGVTGKQEGECRKYFVNWLMKQPINNTQNGGIQRQSRYDRRRAVEPPQSPEAYTNWL